MTCRKRIRGAHSFPGELLDEALALMAQGSRVSRDLTRRQQIVVASRKRLPTPVGAATTAGDQMLEGQRDCRQSV
jgi:hypothetical protein